MTDNPDTLPVSKMYSDATTVYKQWIGKIARAKTELDLAKKVKRWKANYRRLQGNAEGSESESLQVANEVGLSVRELKGMLFPTVPMPIVSADKEETEQLLPCYEWLPHKELKRSRNKRILRKVMDDALCCDRGYLKCTYEYRPGQQIPQQQDEVPENQIAAEMMKVKAEHMGVMMGQPPMISPADLHWLHKAQHRLMMSRMDPYSEQYWQISVHLGDHNTISADLQPGRIKMDRVSPKNFLFDPDNDWEERAWSAELVWKHIDDIKNDPLLENTDGVTAVKKNDSITESKEPDIQDSKMSAMDSDGEDEGPKYVPMWYIHDRKNELLIIISKDHKNKLPLYVGPWPYACEIYHPLDLIQCAEEKGNLTIMERAWEVQKELDEVEAKIKVIISEYMPMVFVEDGVASEPEEEDEIKRKDTVFKRCSPGTAGRIREVNLQLPLEPLQKRAEKLVQKIRDIIGIWEQASGIPQAESATQAQLLANKEGINTKQPLDIVSDWMGDISYAILMLHRECSTTEMMVKSQGTPGLGWRMIRPEEIPTDIDVTVEELSWGDGNPDLRTRQWTEALPLLKQSPYLDQQKIDLETMRRQNIRNPQRFLAINPQIPPMPPMGSPADLSGPSAGPVSMAQDAGNAVGLENRGTPTGQI